MQGPWRGTRLSLRISLPVTRRQDLKLRTRRRWQSLGIAVLAMLVFVQSVMAVLPNQGLDSRRAAAEMAMDGASMPCDHGNGDCCDEDAPLAPCEQMTSCAGGDCAMRVVVLPMPVPALVAAQPEARLLPADSPHWLLTRHDSPLLRPPISA